MQPSDETDIARRVAAEVAPVEGITRVSVGDGDEAVYRLQVSDSDGSTRTLFVREVSERRIEALERALDLEADIGIPESEILLGDPPLLVMQRAIGRPLSVLLPVLLLPGVWSRSSTELSNAGQSVGEFLGRLHTETLQGLSTPLGHPEFEKCLSYTNRLDEQLGDELSASVHAQLSDIEDTEFQVSCVFSDPTPHNIYYASGDIELIDFTFYYNLSVKDLVTFERGIELMAGRLPYGRRSQVSTIIESFRAGYEECAPDIDPSHDDYARFKLADYCYVLDKYLNRQLGGSSSSLRSRLTRHTDISVCTTRISELAGQSED